MKPGIRFHPGAVRPAGHIFFIPAAERVTDDTKNRPHFLANRCDPAADPDGLATLAHMSTRNTECIQYGCSCHPISNSRLKRADQDGNFVVAARLVPELPENLKVSGMSAVDEVPSLRAAVMRAIASGDERTRPAPEGVRGRLVRVLDRKADFRYGVVVTEGKYSAQRRYQVVVPIIDRVVDGDDGPELLEPTRWDVVPAAQAWTRTLPLEQPMLDTAGTISLTERWQKGNRRAWLRKQLEVLEGRVDAATLADVEARIVERLRL
jgi:hypothetical protein